MCSEIEISSVRGVCEVGSHPGLGRVGTCGDIYGASRWLHDAHWSLRLGMLQRSPFRWALPYGLMYGSDHIATQKHPSSAGL